MNQGGIKKNHSLHGCMVELSVKQHDGSVHVTCQSDAVRMQPTANVRGSSEVSGVDTTVFSGTATAELLGVIPSRCA